MPAVFMLTAAVLAPDSIPGPDQLYVEAPLGLINDREDGLHLIESCGLMDATRVCVLTKLNEDIYVAQLLVTVAW